MTYEALHRDPHCELAKTIAFLGLDWSEEDVEKTVEVNSAANMVNIFLPAVRANIIEQSLTESIALCRACGVALGSGFRARSLARR